MEISVKRNYGYYLVFKAENINVEEDIEQRIYSQKEDGKIDHSKPPLRDISTDVIDSIIGVCSDLIEYRLAEYDSSELVFQLFTKLPKNAAKTLLLKLNHEYSDL